MGRLFIVTGVPGTGKSTVCNQLLSLAEGEGVKVKIVNFGSVMLELLKSMGKNLDRDAMRHSSIFFQRSLQENAVKKINQIVNASNCNVVLDTHMSIRTEEGYLPGLPFYVLKKLKPSFLVVIESPVEDIIARRNKDKTRIREVTERLDVEEEVSFSRIMALTCSILSGAPVKIIRNLEGKQREAAMELLKLFGCRSK